MKVLKDIKAYELIILALKLDGALRKVEPTIRKDVRILIIKDAYTKKIINKCCKLGPIDHNDIQYGITSVTEDKKKLCEDLGIHIQEEDWPAGELPDYIYGDFRIVNEDNKVLFEEMQSMGIELRQQIVPDKDFIMEFGTILDGCINKYEYLELNLLEKAVVQTLVKYNRQIKMKKV